MDGLNIGPGITAILCPDPQEREAFSLSLCGEADRPPPFEPGRDSFLVSAKQAEALIEAQEKLDDSDYTDGAVYQGRALLEFVSSFGRPDPGSLSRIGLEPILGRGIRFLSNGEMRKAISMAALSGRASRVVFDDPYDGLDPDSRAALLGAFSAFIVRNPRSSIVLLFEHVSDMPGSADASFVLCPDGLLPASRPEADAYLESLKRAAHAWGLPPSPRVPSPASTKTEPASTGPASTNRAAIIEMRGVELAYDGRNIFSLPAWRVEEGEHWLIRGPNGCGKSSLLGMICGDNVKAYGQDVAIFGVKKGSGESVWDLKKSIGAVSREFHLRYRVNLSLEDTVVSGCFDSIGLYEIPARSQSEKARVLCEAAGWGPETRSKGFLDSPYAVQRLALILRALVKEPRLLILDEPCQGLDDAHRDAFLESLSALVSGSSVSSLYVTHREEEIPQYMTNVLRFVPLGNAFSCVAENLAEPKGAS